MGIQLKSTKEFFIIESDEEEEFIDMEILGSPCCYYNNKKEFEFQLMPSLNEQHNKASADELFYKGKLLPLPLGSNNKKQFVEFEQVFSPPESCRVSCELFHSVIGDGAVVASKRSSWSTLGRKLIKVSRSYLKSFFLFPHNKAKNEVVHCSSSSITSFDGISGTHSNSSSSSSSSSSSLNSSDSLYYHLHCLNRFSSSSFDLETPIDGAIAHCKQSCSQHFFTASTSDNTLLVKD